MSNAKENQKIIDNYDYLSKAASAGDCTGLIPSLPKNEVELESYNELYQYLPPAANKETHSFKHEHPGK